MPPSAARQVSEDRCQDPLRSRNLEGGNAGLGPEWAGGVIPTRPRAYLGDLVGIWANTGVMHKLFNRLKRNYLRSGDSFLS